MKRLEALSIEKREREKIREFIKRIKDEFGKDILYHFLFGSFARDAYDKDSDIDIFIVLRNKNSRNIRRIYEIATDVYLKFGGAVFSLKLLDEKYYRFLIEVGSEFIKSLEKEKILL